ncbi:hypothetical protein [Pedobacter metabolipauper]|uniref:Uncharacterized protein n=1 Tax=Pedobacter metabolipauper TaxID=425513 RepID=A0A4R6SZZ1_9SPHI|nr:hypothetical protein [Pedobacter metabolipauper]TDQ10135.1 hypothetical protein ATK78_2300 [Pedobacter metabolipauper]
MKQIKSKTKMAGDNRIKPILSFRKKDYYFHPDDDFREDDNWGKAATLKTDDFKRLAL